MHSVRSKRKTVPTAEQKTPVSLLGALEGCHVLRRLPVVLLQMAIDCAYSTCITLPMIPNDQLPTFISERSVCNRIEGLRFNGFRMSFDECSDLALSCPHLREFDARKGYVSSGGLSRFAKYCPKIKSIRARGWDVSSQDIIAVARAFPDLEVLDLPKCHMVFDSAFFQVGYYCTKLKVLTITHTGVRDDSITFIAARCRHLTSVTLTRTNITDESACQLAANCPDLELLNLTFTSITDKALYAIANHCRKLKTLVVHGTNVTVPAACAVLQSCPLLSCFFLGETQVDNIDYLQSCPNGHAVKNTFYMEE